MMLNFGWLYSLFIEFKEHGHCPLLPNHKPDKNGLCGMYLQCSTQNRTSKSQCLDTRILAKACGGL